MWVDAMALIPIEWPAANDSLSTLEETFIATGRRWIAAFHADHPAYTTLLLSDPQMFARHLKSLQKEGVLAGSHYCEWGSGVGLIAGLAAINGMRVFAIEQDAALVAGAHELFAQFGLRGQLAVGSFVPAIAPEDFAVHGTYGATDWQPSTQIDPYVAMGCRLAEMDLIYAYPWPREVDIYASLFEFVASAGAVLWLYRQDGAPLLLRKT